MKINFDNRPVEIEMINHNTLDSEASYVELAYWLDTGDELDESELEALTDYAQATGDIHEDWLYEQETNFTTHELEH